MTNRQDLAYAALAVIYDVMALLSALQGAITSAICAALAAATYTLLAYTMFKQRGNHTNPPERTGRSQDRHLTGL